MTFDKWGRQPEFPGQRSECVAGSTLWGNVGSKREHYWSHQKGHGELPPPCSCGEYRSNDSPRTPRSQEAWLRWAKDQPEWNKFCEWFAINCDHLDQNLSPRERWAIFNRY